MGEQHIVEVRPVELSADETAAALAAAAATAPTTEAEARAAAAAAAKPVRPDNVPEKFWDAEAGKVNHDAMLASYAELEKKVGAPAEEALVEEEEELEVTQEDQETDELEDAAEFDLAVFDTEYAEAGELSEASYESLAAKGFNKATVDGYIAGQEALGQIATQRITEAAGGAEAMERMFAWATTSLPVAEIDTFNESFQHADVNAGVISMESLKAKYEAANGKDPVLLGGKPSGTGADSFTSWAEVTVAMSKPEYKTDHAYREKVAAKLSRSNVR